MRTRTEITLETDRWIVVGRKKEKRWCSTCALEVEMLSIDDAALRAQVNSRTIFQWAESGMVHWTESAKGLLLICPISLNLNV